MNYPRFFSGSSLPRLTIHFFSGTTETYLRKSKGMSEKSIENITTSDNTFAPSLVNSDLLPNAKLFNNNTLFNNNIYP